MNTNSPSLVTQLSIVAAFALAAVASTGRASAQVPAVGQGPAGVTCPSAVKGPEARALGSQVSIPVRDKQIPMDMFYRREGTKLFGTGSAKDGGGANIATKGDIQPDGTVKVYEIKLQVGVAELTFDPRDMSNFSTNDGSLQTAPAGERNAKFARITVSLQHSEDLAAKAITDKCGAPEVTNDPASAPAPLAGNGSTASPGNAGATGARAGGGAGEVTWRPDGPTVREGSITTSFSRFGIDVRDAQNGHHVLMHLMPVKSGGLQTQTIDFMSPDMLGVEIYNPGTGAYMPSTAEVKRGARAGASPGGPPQGMAMNIAPYIQAAHRAIDIAKASSGSKGWDDESFRTVLNGFAPEATPPGGVKKPAAPGEKPKQ